METEYKTQEEYNTQYAQLCAEIGDKFIRAETLSNQIADLKGKIAKLAEESAAAAAHRNQSSNP